ncbi:M28 family metallopeptidase [Rhodotorula paludigena]|uniref:M28 family metallopeptidase n=1 Tax=Rhodotorula paludigena TaxID=86838 RepID=UPI00316E12BD
MDPDKRLATHEKGALLPAPSPTRAPPRSADSSHRYRRIAAALLVLCLGWKLWTCTVGAEGYRQTELSPLDHHLDRGYLAHLVGSSHCPHRNEHAKPPISHDDVVQTILDTPQTEGSRAALKTLTNETHIAGTPGDRRVALWIKSQWEELLGAPSDPEHKNLFDAGTPESLHALTQDTRRRRHGHGAHRRDGSIVGRAKRALRRLAHKIGLEERRGHGVHGRHGKHPEPQRPRVWTDTYYSLLTYPVSASVSTFANSSASEPTWRAKLKEDAFPDEDPTSPAGACIWHGFSANGTARGQLVYASRGTQADFAALRERGIDVRGKVVLVQYGGVFRGLKVKAASEAGALAVLIYDDPAADGPGGNRTEHAAYPAGQARNPSAVQRGSVQYLSLYPGDPLTPGEPSYNPALPGAPERLPRDSEGVNIPDIPSLPLSYGDAIPLLKSLNGKGFRWESDREGMPAGWREGDLGAEGVEYWAGPSEEVVEVVNRIEEKVTAIWNTYAVIPGQVADEVVVLGNHHDAWTFGAVDPNSGTASVHETVRALGALLKLGWKPLRTILLAGWDAEEYGLIGSTEFGEDFSTWLQEHVVAYLNVDVAVGGSEYDLNASPSLADLLAEVSKLVPHPDKEGKTLKVTEVSPLGSGSDFTVFLQRLGLACANFGLDRGANDPVYHYHSNYDSFAWQSRFGDPSFKRHQAIARVLGLATVRLASDPVVPLNTTAYAIALSSYLDKVRALPGADSLDLSRLDALAGKIERASSALLARGAHLANRLADRTSPPSRHKAHALVRRLRSVNRALRRFEGGFLGDEQGLQGREWYRHLGVAPGRWFGYGATTLPGLSEALALDRDVEQAKVEVKRLEKAFRGILRGLEHA